MKIIFTFRNCIIEAIWYIKLDEIVKKKEVLSLKLTQTIILQNMKVLCSLLIIFLTIDLALCQTDELEHNVEYIDGNIQ